jgi:predicted amidohydrolase
MTLTVAAVQPACAAKDVAANARTHADAIRAAGARLVVFPELSVTGYELDADPVSLEALDEIVAACSETDSIALVGAPIAGDRIATLRVQASGVDVA